MDKTKKKEAEEIINSYYTGGGFKNNLLKTVQSADRENLKNLAVCLVNSPYDDLISAYFFLNGWYLDTEIYHHGDEPSTWGFVLKVNSNLGGEL